MKADRSHGDGGAGARAIGREDRHYDLAGRLTERDRVICRRLLLDHRVLTTPQVGDVAFRSLRKAQERLSVLFALGVVDHFRFRSWSGVAVVAAERGVVVADLGWHRETTTALATNQIADRDF